LHSWIFSLCPHPSFSEHPTSHVLFRYALPVEKRDAAFVGMFQRYYAVSLGLNSITGTSKITYLKQHWVLGGMRWHRLACPFCVVTTSQGIRGFLIILSPMKKSLRARRTRFRPPLDELDPYCSMGGGKLSLSCGCFAMTRDKQSWVSCSARMFFIWKATAGLIFQELIQFSLL
jgi:hypothetical protein